MPVLDFKRFRLLHGVLCMVLMLAIAVPISAQNQKIHEEYTAKIKEFTTDDHFNTKFMRTMPYSDTVPTPLEILGRIAGARDFVSYSHEIYKYMRALDEASPRVKVFTRGKSEEGRDILLVVISDENTIQNLDRYREINAKLGDPRTISESEAKQLIQEAKPMYWATGAMHSGETGSPEMLMELAYRIAVDESEFIKTIRDKAIVMITPLLEVDGRDKMVDCAMAPRKDPEGSYPTRPLYWGKYVVHDNNRDNLGLSLALSRHLTNTFFEFHPQVLHDLHESASHLYVSTGTGPYNAWLDPLVIDEWHMISYQEVNTMTREGVPGVWTHAFYDGWAPNYGFYAANGHNAIGRFYETQGAGDGSTRIITTRGARAWYRPNPPLPRTLWSIRNNVNLQGSAIQIAINFVAKNHERFMENFYLKSQRATMKPYNEGPSAYLFPSDDPRPGQAARLLKLLQWQGVEIHRATEEIKIGEKKYGEGSYVVRMDQPYSRMADMMLDRQYFNTNDSRPYDDVGWTMGPLYNVKTERIDDTDILKAGMEKVDELSVPGGTKSLAGASTVAYLLNHNADNSLATFRFKQRDMVMHAAEESFKVGDKEFNPGTFILKTDENSGNLGQILGEAGKEFGFTAYSVDSLPEVPTHKVAYPRVALMHDWVNVQTEGWIRIALDELQIPYDYISVHEARDNPRLRDKYDVILFGPVRGNPTSVLDGRTGDKPLPWKKTEYTPNIGVQASTDDMRGGLGLEGILHLRNFVQDGGLFVTIQGSSAVPIHFGLAKNISIKTTPGLWAGGSVFKADIADQKSPIAYGYGDELGVYFSRAPVFALGGGGFSRFRRPGAGASGRVTGRGSRNDPDIPQGRPRDLGKESIAAFEKAREEAGEEEPRRPGAQRRHLPRTILRFTRNADNLLISGGLANGEQMAGSPAVVDCKLGDGHVVMFSINPMWRHETHGSFFLVFNAMMHFDNLDAGKKKDIPATEQ